jgi:hypothetical protein
MSLIVIGTSPTTNEVLVKDTLTGGLTWKPGTPSQISEATGIINNGEEYNGTYEDPNSTVKTQKTTLTTTKVTKPAYEWVDGQFYYNPDNTARIENISNLAVNPNYKGTTSIVTKTPVPSPLISTQAKIPAYEIIDGTTYYNPDNSAGLPNAKSLPINPGKSSLVNVAQVEVQKSIIDQLDEYKIGDGSNRHPYAYDIVSYLRDNPNAKSVDTLIKAGFNKEDIDKAQIESIKPISLEEFTADYLKKKYPDENYTESELKNRKKLDDESYDEYYQRLAKKDEILREATSAYVTKYGKGALAGTGIARVGEFVFSPSRALRPEVTIRDISKEEWIIGGAQVALLVVAPVAGRVLSGVAGQVVSKGVQMAAGGVFAADTAKNWDKMSDTERAISLAFDVLIIGTALPGKQIRELSARGLKTLNADQRGYFKLDSSKTVIDSLEYNGIKVPESVKTDLNKSLREIQTSIKFKDLKGIEKEAQNLNQIADGLEDIESKIALKAYAKKLVDNPKSAIEIVKGSEEYPEQSRNAIEDVELLQKNRAAELKKTPEKQIQVKERPKIEEFPVKDLKKEAEIQAAKDKALEDAIKLEKRKKELMEELRKQHEEVKVDPENPPTVEENLELRKKVQAEIVRRLEKRLNESLKKSIKEAEKKRIEIQKQLKLSNKESTKLINELKTKPDTKIETQLKEQLQLKLKQQLALKLELKQALALKTQLKLQLKTQNQLSLKTKPANETKLESKTNEKPKESEDKGKKSDAVKSVRGTKVEEKGKERSKLILKLKGGKSEIPEGETYSTSDKSWKQGIGYWLIKYPYGKNDRIFTIKKPIGAEMHADQKSAFDTIQSMGYPNPVNYNFDMGIVDVHISNPPAKPSEAAGRKSIKFTRDPDDIYKGKRPMSRSKKIGPYHYKNGALSRNPL